VHVGAAAEATVETASGDVRIEQADGPVTVRTASGDVRIAQISGRRAEVKSASGDVSVATQHNQLLPACLSGHRSMINGNAHW
jgi:DUF4097 and DUF4098 domain-containing protein YvlB